MATCLTVIKRALRMLGALPGGRDPDASDAADAMQALQGLYGHLVASGTFGRATDVLVDADYTANENERVINTSASPITVTGPTTIDDPTADNGVRAPRDRSFLIIAGPTPTVHIYDGNLASWVDIDALTLTSTAPFSGRFETGLSALLAAHISPEFSDKPPPQVVVAAVGQFMSAMTQRWDSGHVPTVAEYL